MGQVTEARTPSRTMRTRVSPARLGTEYRKEEPIGRTCDESAGGARGETGAHISVRPNCSGVVRHLGDRPGAWRVTARTESPAHAPWAPAREAWPGTDPPPGPPRGVAQRSWGIHGTPRVLRPGRRHRASANEPAHMGRHPAGGRGANAPCWANGTPGPPRRKPAAWSGEDGADPRLGARPGPAARTARVVIGILGPA